MEVQSRCSVRDRALRAGRAPVTGERKARTRRDRQGPTPEAERLRFGHSARSRVVAMLIGFLRLTAIIVFPFTRTFLTAARAPARGRVARGRAPRRAGRRSAAEHRRRDVLMAGGARGRVCIDSDIRLDTSRIVKSYCSPSSSPLLDRGVPRYAFKNVLKRRSARSDPVSASISAHR